MVLYAGNGRYSITRKEVDPVEGYHNLNVAIGGSLISELRELKIFYPFNEHARVSLTALIAEELINDWLETLDSKSMIEVSRSNGPEDLLFKGKIADFRVYTEQNTYYIEIEGISLTGELDIKQKTRVFQDDKMSFGELVKQILAEYNGEAVFYDPGLERQKVGRFIVQYQETDWEFLIRVASRFYSGVISNATAAKVQFWVGCLQKKPLELPQPLIKSRKSWQHIA